MQQNMCTPTRIESNHGQFSITRIDGPNQHWFKIQGAGSDTLTSTLEVRKAMHDYRVKASELLHDLRISPQDWTTLWRDLSKISNVVEYRDRSGHMVWNFKPQTLQIRGTVAE